MAVEFLGSLHSENDRSGRAMLVGVAQGQRYSPISADSLRNLGLYAHVESVQLFSSAAAAGNLVLLKNDDPGPFFQASAARGSGDVWWDTWGHTGSVLMIASDKVGERETRVSFQDQFLSQWNSFLDAELQGSQARRDGDPRLTWEMFPEAVSHLDRNLTYLKIHQPLHISIDWWPDYAASMTYHIYLYVNPERHVRAWGARWAYWVEGGAKSGAIADRLEPRVRDGLGTLQDQLNRILALLDLLGEVSDVYYLPGRQLTPIGTRGLAGNTDDITIVIEQR